MRQNKKGFTLIELLVVIAIIGLLSTLSILALNQARARARDAKRISDVRQLQTAIELYYNDKNDYPNQNSITPGASIYNNGNVVYLAAVPTPPQPIDGANCPAANAYTYTESGAGTASTYTIQYCLGATINNVTGNRIQTASSLGIRLP
jgi:prepilin-type N-terminal cleavage/methylation domain-containing protein